MSNIGPTVKPTDAAAGAPVLSRISTLLRAQGILAIVVTVLVIVGGALANAGMTDVERADAKRKAAEVSSAGKLLGLITLVLFIACVVAVFVLVSRVKRGYPASTRTWAIGVEVVLALLGLNSTIHAANVVSGAITVALAIGLPIWILTLLLSDDAKQAFTNAAGAATAGRFDVRDLPKLP